jgi:predicted RNA-binding Zn-ribbon protein involved in translation (DUF1610 family)
MNNETKRCISELPRQIAGAISEEMLKFTCPNCGGSLVIHFTGGKRRSLGVSCERQCFATNMDGMPEDPKWVGALGVHVVTGRRSQERQ